MTTFEVVKKLCNERKISINDLENSLGYSKNTLYRLKTQTPGADKLQNIADYFNVSTDYLLGRSNTPHLENNTEEITDDDYRKIERFARNLTPKNRKKALKILEATFDDAFGDDDDDDDDI